MTAFCLFGSLDAVEVGCRPRQRPLFAFRRTGLRNRKLKPNLDRFQETIPARLCAIKRAQRWSCSDCGGEDAEGQEAGLSESQPMITWPDAHEPLLRRRKDRLTFVIPIASKGDEPCDIM